MGIFCACNPCACCCRGEKGDKGEQGFQGIQGLKGDTGAKGDRGDKGEAGAQGLKGDKGDVGAVGATGATGEAGAVVFAPSPSNGTIIPFRSGQVLGLALGEEASQGAIIGGSGNWAPGFSVEQILNYYSSSAPVAMWALSMPRDGTLTAIYATAYVTSATVSQDTALTLQLYSAPAGSTTFAPIADAVVKIVVPSTFSGATAISGSVEGLSDQIPAGSQVVMMAYLVVPINDGNAVSISFAVNAGANII